MLKIAKYRYVPAEDGKSIKKEYIDLKELEKFGFEVIVLDGEIMSYTKSFEHPCYNSINIYPHDRQISYFNRPNLDTIFDLITAGVVEKV